MKSMTGFGKSQIKRDELICDVEIKSVNGRYLDLKCYLPRELSFLEMGIRNMVSKHITRGTVDFRLNLNDLREPKSQISTSKLKALNDIIKQAEFIINKDISIGIQYLLEDSDLVLVSYNYEDDDLLKTVVNETIEKALLQIVQSMKNEGYATKQVLSESIYKMERSLSRVENQIEPYKNEMMNNMQHRVNELLRDYQIEITEQRLLQETALFIDRYDISEEISRLKAHFELFKKSLESEEDVGKTLNFIIQEIQREANTLGSKFSNSKTFEDILIIKEETEKCREIVQNVA